MLTRCCSALLVGMLVSSVVAQEKRLPRVVLVGDSIRIGYAPVVAKQLDGKAIVISPTPNGEDVATTTPILDNRHAQRKAGFDRFEADVQKYNAAAMSIMKQAGVPVNDLHKVLEDGGKDTLLSGDGTHYTQDGYERLGAAVTDSILRSLGPESR